jgi:hypothetical protein
MTIARVHSLVTFECDGCAEVFEADTVDFDAAMRTFRADGWRAAKLGGQSRVAWHHFCPECVRRKGWD